MKILPLIVAASTVLSAPAWAESDVEIMSFFNGNNLLEMCTGSRAMCTGYVAGVSDLASVQNLIKDSKLTQGICQPPEVTTGQITDIVIKYLQETPAERHGAASILVVLALTKAFPCR